MIALQSNGGGRDSVAPGARRSVWPRGWGRGWGVGHILAGRTTCPTRRGRCRGSALALKGRSRRRLTERAGRPAHSRLRGAPSGILADRLSLKDALTVATLLA